MDKEKIEKRAYHIWERNGKKEGHDKEDWLEAETELWIEEQQQKDFYYGRKTLLP